MGFPIPVRCRLYIESGPRASTKMILMPLWNLLSQRLGWGRVGGGFMVSLDSVLENLAQTNTGLRNRFRFWSNQTRSNCSISVCNNDMKYKYIIMLHHKDLTTCKVKLILITGLNLPVAEKYPGVRVQIDSDVRNMTSDSFHTKLRSSKSQSCIYTCSCLLLCEKWCCNQAKILYMPRQLGCRGMYEM